MKGLDFDYELWQLIEEAKLEIELAKEFGETTSFAREISRALCKNRNSFAEIESTAEVFSWEVLEIEDTSIPF